MIMQQMEHHEMGLRRGFSRSSSLGCMSLSGTRRRESEETSIHRRVRRQRGTWTGARAEAVHPAAFRDRKDRRWSRPTGVYEYPIQDGTWNVTATNNRAYQLKAIEEANRRIQQ